MVDRELPVGFSAPKSGNYYYWHAPWLFHSDVSVSDQTSSNIKHFGASQLTGAPIWLWGYVYSPIRALLSSKQMWSARMKQEMGKVSIFCQTRWSIPARPEPSRPPHSRDLADITTRWCCCCCKFSAQEDFSNTQSHLVFSGHNCHFRWQTLNKTLVFIVPSMKDEEVALSSQEGVK